MRTELKRIEIMPVLRVTLLFSLVFGFLIGILYAALFSVIAQYGSAFEELPVTSVGVMGSISIVIASVIFITIINVTAALLFTVLYNVTASLFGGIVVDFEVKDSNSPTEQPSQ
ncbi:MAG: DUF3566 domain-containing protein [candidate division KSB1 bacterium]|nr:DUF3566 domain-containing protein [candidate division KSB1 bacterium]